MQQQYPKRLIEIDLPIKRISVHARGEKNMRRGHIPLLHIYPAARPTAACRAVMCAALWPDPADQLCPPMFRRASEREMMAFATAAVSNRTLGEICDNEAWKRYGEFARCSTPVTQEALRSLLLDFIADYASSEGSNNSTFIETARRITAAAHSSLTTDGSLLPLVVDSFAGGGAIPLEAARLGIDSFASDSSPVAALLNKVILEFVPDHRGALVAEVKKQIDWIKDEAEKALRHLYPLDVDGAIPTTYLWARTVECEGPSCGLMIPLIRSLRLVRKGNRGVYLKMLPRPELKRVEFELSNGADPNNTGTVRRGSATCPLCGYTTPVDSVRRQLSATKGGVNNSQLLAVVTTRRSARGRSYRLPTTDDRNAVRQATEELAQLLSTPCDNGLSAIPTEPISLNEIRRVSIPLYGMTHWGDLFTPRQAIALSTFSRLVKEAGKKVKKKRGEAFGNAVQVCLALLVDKLADMNASLCVWQNHAEIPAHVFGRWAIGMVFDFAETNPLAQSSGSPESSGKRLLDGLRVILAAQPRRGHAELADATYHPLPDDSAHLFMIDPPYYDAIPYAHLMDFFYVWLRRNLVDIMPDLFSTDLILKETEIVVDRPHQRSTSRKDVAFYERELTKAFVDGRRVLSPNGIGVIVFASKTTASWEAILQAIVEAGWVITASWPIDTEMESRVAAQGQARLASSIHLVCRPRENPDGSVRSDEIGDWRDVLHELPHRIHEWMPRLAEEGVVGADAIFACLGPALEIFSRYACVEKADGSNVPLKDYLQEVWAAVANEALTMVFEGADASGFEEDARLTAMWLWTLFAGITNGTESGSELEDEHAEESDDEKTSAKGSKPSGFVLEYDAARKIAQGLGARLETLSSLVEVKGDKARLLPVAERTKYLFGTDEAQAPTKRKKKEPQGKLFEIVTEAESEAGGWGSKSAPKLGDTVLDRVHQSMILFAANRSEALKRFLVDDGAGSDERFWRLAQALVALYPKGTDERRWIEGVMGKKKGLGF